MTDVFTKEQRSAVMRRVRGKDTGPEMVVRRLLTALGYRYRLHRADLPGRPDIVFPGRRKAIFVHGCFWHGHDCRAGRNRPASNTSYWSVKLARTMARDERHCRELPSPDQQASGDAKHDNHPERAGRRPVQPNWGNRFIHKHALPFCDGLKG